MRSDSPVFCGRETLVRLATDLVDAGRASGVPGAEARPVLVMEGCGGSGRTAVLEFLAQQHRRAVPQALVDARTSAGESKFGGVSGLLLSAVVGFGFSAKSTEFGRIPFSRLFVVYAALTHEIDPDQPEGRQRAAMEAALATYRDRTKVIELWGSLLAATLKSLVAKRTGVDLGDATSLADANTAAAKRLSRALALRSLKAARDWFGTLHVSGDPLQTWLDVSRAGRRAEQDEIDKFLVAAFLADLRAAGSRHGWYRRLVGPRPPRWNCELLLDNADHDAAVRLLRCLAGVRASAGVDPLVVVAASGGRMITAMQPADQQVRVLDEPELAGLARADLVGVRWLVVRLAPLTEAEVVALVEGRRGLETLGSSRVARAVFVLAGGHPGATRRVLDALERDPALFGSLDVLLDSVVRSRDDRTTVAGEIIDEIATRPDTGDEPGENLRANLVTLAATRHRDEAERLAKSRLLTKLLDTDPELLFADALWPRRSTDRPRTMLPVARFLLLRELAQRPASAPAAWGEVFWQLARDAEADDDTVGRLHHLFALGETAYVAAGLAGLLATTSDDEWLRMLDEIVATPNPKGRLDGASDDHPEIGNAVQRHVIRLAEALRDLRDPRLTDETAVRDLRRKAADLYRKVGRESPLPSNEFRTRAEQVTAPRPVVMAPVSTPPRPVPGPPSWPRRRPVPAAATALLAVAAVTAGAVHVVGNRPAAHPPVRCPSVAADEPYVWPDRHGSCLLGLGGAAAGAPPFRGQFTGEVGAKFRDLLEDIRRENHAAATGIVAGGATTCNPIAGKSVVVAVLGPWSSELAGSRAYHELEGAYVAQWRANHLGKPGGCGPYIRMVAADPGPDLNAWRSLVDGLHTYPDLVAVTGLALSRTQMIDAARRLNGYRIPVVADLVTADGFDQTNFDPVNFAGLPMHCDSLPNPGQPLDHFHRIAFGNKTHIERLAGYLRSAGLFGPDMVAQVTQNKYEQDPYACTNVARVKQQISPSDPTRARDPITFDLSDGNSDPSGQIENQLTRICNDRAVQTVYYTARGLDLATFIQTVADRCGRPLTVAAASDATRLLVTEPNETRDRQRRNALRALQTGKVRLFFTVSSTPQQLAGQPGYTGFREAFDGAFAEGPKDRQRPTFSDDELLDTWALNAHDAMYTVAQAVHDLYKAQQKYTPENTSSNLGTDTVPDAAQGTISFGSGATVGFSNGGQTRTGPSVVRLCFDGARVSIPIANVGRPAPSCPGDPTP